MQVIEELKTRLQFAGSVLEERCDAGSLPNDCCRETTPQPTAPACPGLRPWPQQLYATLSGYSNDWAGVYRVNVSPNAFYPALKDGSIDFANCFNNGSFRLKLVSATTEFAVYALASAATGRIPVGSITGDIFMYEVNSAEALFPLANALPVTPDGNTSFGVGQKYYLPITTLNGLVTVAEDDQAVLPNVLTPTHIDWRQCLLGDAPVPYAPDCSFDILNQNNAGYFTMNENAVGVILNAHKQNGFVNDQQIWHVVQSSSGDLGPGPQWERAKLSQRLSTFGMIYLSVACDGSSNFDMRTYLSRTISAVYDRPTPSGSPQTCTAKTSMVLMAFPSIPSPPGTPIAQSNPFFSGGKFHHAIGTTNNGRIDITE